MIKLRNLPKRLLMMFTFLLYGWRKVLTPRFEAEPGRILVLYLSGIGDIICLSRFYAQLKEPYPTAQLWAAFPSAYVPLTREFFVFDGYIAHENYRATLKQINAERFDLILLPGWLLKDSLLALLSNARSILGYINDRSFSNRFINTFCLEAIGRKVTKRCKDMRLSHLSERPSLLVEELGIQPLPAEGITLPRSQPAQNYAVFHASARLESKRWPPQRFAEVARHLLEQGICEHIHLIGDKYDKAMNAQIIRLVDSDKLENHAGKLNLLQSKELIAAAKLFVGNDSGPMHIAAWSGVPTLGLLGPYPPEICRPLGANSRYVFHRFDCTGCDPGSCKHNFRCMEAITSEEVIAAINDLLDEQIDR